MKQMLQIRCKNNKKTLEVSAGSTLSEVFAQTNLQMDYGPIAAKVNNKVQGLHYRLYNNKDVEFLDMYSGSAERTYTRTLFLVCCKAIHDLYRGAEVVIDIPVSKGYFVHMDIGSPVAADDVEVLAYLEEDDRHAGILAVRAIFCLRDLSILDDLVEHVLAGRRLLRLAAFLQGLVDVFGKIVSRFLAHLGDIFGDCFCVEFSQSNPSHFLKKIHTLVT